MTEGAIRIRDNRVPECQLYQISLLADGLSGRALRKLPLKAHAIYIQRPVATISEFLWALQEAIKFGIA